MGTYPRDLEQESHPPPIPYADASMDARPGEWELGVGMCAQREPGFHALRSWLVVVAVEDKIFQDINDVMKAQLSTFSRAMTARTLSGVLNAWNEAGKAARKSLFEHAEETLNFLSEAWVFRRPIYTRHAEHREQCREVYAVKFSAAVDDDDLQKPAMASDAFSDHHGARLTTRRAK